MSRGRFLVDAAQVVAAGQPAALAGRVKVFRWHHVAWRWPGWIRRARRRCSWRISGGFGGGGLAAGGAAGSFRSCGGGGGGGGLRGAPAASYVVASDGMLLHALGEAQGKELKKPIQFLPANANATELVFVGDTIYTSTINNCGGVPNGVWAVNTTDGTVSSWKSGASPVFWSNRAFVQWHALCSHRKRHGHVSRCHCGARSEDSRGERLVVHAGTRILNGPRDIHAGRTRNGGGSSERWARVPAGCGIARRRGS